MMLEDVRERQGAAGTGLGRAEHLVQGVFVF
jgi:hypothetical protein